MVGAAGRLFPGNIGKTRLAAATVSSLTLLANLPQIGNAERTPAWLLASFMAIVFMVTALVLTSLLRRAPWWDSFTLPLLIVIGGSGLRDPLTTVTLALAVTLTLSLYGPMWLWAARTLGSFVAVPAAVAISPMSLGRRMAWDSAAMINMIAPLTLMALMMRGIYLALRHQESVSARDAVLARTGSRMISMTDVESVRRTGIEAAREIVRLTPGVAFVVLRRGPAGLYVHNAAGLPDEVLGVAVPETVVADPQLIAAFTGRFRHWRIETVSDDLHSLVGGIKPVQRDIADAFWLISHQVILGETACRSHAELDYQANHDDLTGLPTRAKFFKELREALRLGPPGTVALLQIDLDDFKQVNDTYGHAGGDDLLVELAGRIGQAGGAGALAARLGGDEFALLLTGLTHSGAAQQVASERCAALSEPVTLGSAAVRVGASIGIALADVGLTPDELTRRADIAMYAAKVRGKHQVERFDPARHQDRGGDRLQHA